MQSVFGFLELRTGNILIGLLSVIQSIAIILAGSASYAESEFSDFHLTWIGMSSMLLIASLLFLKGVGDRVDLVLELADSRQMEEKWIMGRVTQAGFVRFLRAVDQPCLVE